MTSDESKKIIIVNANPYLPELIPDPIIDRLRKENYHSAYFLANSFAEQCCVNLLDTAKLSQSQKNCFFDASGNTGQIYPAGLIGLWLRQWILWPRCWFSR